MIPMPFYFDLFLIFIVWRLVWHDPLHIPAPVAVVDGFTPKPQGGWVI